jgi:hypothetical protein
MGSAKLRRTRRELLKRHILNVKLQIAEDYRYDRKRKVRGTRFIRFQIIHGTVFSENEPDPTSDAGGDLAIRGAPCGDPKMAQYVPI